MVTSTKKNIKLITEPAFLPNTCYVRLWVFKTDFMRILNQNTGVFLQEDEYYSKVDILNLYRLQKQLLITENLVASISECSNIWQRYSSDLCASWLFFPDKDEDILKQVSSSNYFTSYHDYAENDCKHPKEQRSYIGSNLLRCGVCGDEFS